MQIDKITRKGKEFAVLPMEDLQKLNDAAEMLADVEAFDMAKRRVKRGEDELIPFELIERRVAGENALKIWREYRGLTQESLAKASKASRPMIAAIETGSKNHPAYREIPRVSRSCSWDFAGRRPIQTGHKKGGIDTLKRLAAALKVDLDNLA